ncbi:MAG: hypothetical protein VX223_15235, partial [Myxococcota bacterium]|nr:hypothetical protein [Myxococcota bacterium]
EGPSSSDTNSENDVSEPCDGSWESCCTDGVVSTCCCPIGVACNYGVFETCADGSCALPGNCTDGM